jgi:RNA polymerase sigma factor for flagellar operon FliA
MSPQSTASDTVLDHLWSDYIAAGRPTGGAHEDALARHYLPYATQVGERFHRRVGDAVEKDEIVQNGYLGLLDAIRTFDPAEASFQTWANRKIQWKIADSLRGGDWLPRRRRDNVKLVQRAVVLMQHKNNTTPSDEELAEVTGLGVAEVRIAYEDFVAARVHSLNDLTATDDGTGDETINRIFDRTETPLEENALRTALQGHMFQALRTLPDREKQIIALYYYGGHTLEEIGEVFSIGYSRVSQILKRAVLILRTNIEGAPDLGL